MLDNKLSRVTHPFLVGSAAGLFRFGAEWGHVDCAYELGYMYAQGIGVERDPALAAKYLAVVAQVRNCLSNVGCVHTFPTVDGTPENYLCAMYLLRRRAFTTLHDSPRSSPSF